MKARRLTTIHHMNEVWNWHL